MSHVRALVAVAILLVGSSCVIERPRPDLGSARVHGVPARFEEPTVGVSYIPAMRLKADEDPDERNGGILFDPDLKTGEGHGIYFGTGVLQVSYLRTEHTERSTRESVDNHVALVDVVLGERAGFREYDYASDPVDDYGHGFLTYLPYLGVGVGVGLVDYESSFDDVFGALFHVKAGVDLLLGGSVGVGVAVGYMMQGYPGETVAHGSYVSLDGRVSF